MDIFQKAVADYIKGRAEYLCDRVSYQYGYNSIEGIVYGLRELYTLAAAFHLYDLANGLREKVGRLEPYLLKHGHESCAGFVDEL